VLYNLLDPLDQTMFDLGRATGVNIVVQGVWVYDRSMDVDGVRRFHDRLRRGRLSRRIERSSLRFGRHRWISANGSSEIESEIEVASARPRAEFAGWLDEQAAVPLDCEYGPGWRLAVLPFVGGGAGLSLVVSHCLADGLGLCEALVDAVGGRADPVGWPAGGSRRWWRAWCGDVGQAVRDGPAVGRAVVAAVRLARRGRGGGAVLPVRVSAGVDGPVVLPTATVFVAGDEWEARARSLGGTGNALLVGLAVRLAQRVGRVGADGSVVVRMPVNERVAGDIRANANSNVNFTVDPAAVLTDLREIRAAVKQALIRHRQVPDEERAVLAIVPLLPKRLVRVGGGSSSVVVSSNLGVINPVAGRPDGTAADHFALKVRYPGVTSSMVHRFGGLQVFVSGRTRGHVFVSVTAYQPGRPNSNDSLRQDLSSVLTDFSLTGTQL
jgi:diacylglycerol O-acyltransferase / wax synthase